MGNFSRDIRNLTIKSVGIRTVSLDSVKAQYNPYRFKHWKILHEGPPEKVLDIAYSPHVRLLRDYEEKEDIWDDIGTTAYYQMQRRYGRKHKWISEKIRGFIKLYHALIKFPTFKGDSHISVTQRPIRKNAYNKGFEVFEGHHRIACLCKIGIEEIPVTILKVSK